MIENFSNRKKKQKDFKCSIGFAMTELYLWGKKYINLDNDSTAHSKK